MEGWKRLWRLCFGPPQINNFREASTGLHCVGISRGMHVSAFLHTHTRTQFVLELARCDSEASSILSLFTACSTTLGRTTREDTKAVQLPIVIKKQMRISWLCCVVNTPWLSSLKILFILFWLRTDDTYVLNRAVFVCLAGLRWCWGTS